MAKILFIDDDEAILVGVGRVLERVGHQVVPAADGKVALKLAHEDVPDLVITDINMPEMDGIEVITRIHKLNPGIPVIAISGGGKLPKELLLANASILGAVTSLPKPFEITELVEAVDAALASRPPGGDSSGQ